MHLTVVSSLDALCRQQACDTLADAFPRAVVMLHDLLEDGVVVRRTFRRGAPVERERTTLEHGCLSCAVRLDVVPAVAHLHALGEEHVILGLPPAVPASTAVDALRRGLDRPFTVDSTVLACAPAAVEDQIWDRETLFESGRTAVAEDDRTAGEFLLDELALVDTVLPAESGLVPIHHDQRTRGIQLLRELAPHTDIVEHASDLRAGRRRPAGIHRSARTRPDRSRALPPSPFTTVVHELSRPLHPERFYEALAAVAPGCCRLRGHVWIASIPECRIALHGIGPRIWLENTGPWPLDEHAGPPARDGAAARGVPDSPGRHGTVIAATGEDLDAADVEQLLTSCQLTEAELRSGITGLADPFGLDATHEIDNRRTP